MIHLEFEKLMENLMSDAATGPCETSVFDRLCWLQASTFLFCKVSSLKGLLCSAFWVLLSLCSLRRSRISVSVLFTRPNQGPRHPGTFFSFKSLVFLSHNGLLRSQAALTVVL